jgi:hypothetical protein
MKKTQGLSQELLDKCYQSLEDLKSKESYEAMITEVNYAYSNPISIALSPFVKG